MTRRPPTTEIRILLRTILSAGVLAVLVLACAGTAAGATWVVDDDSGAGVDHTTIQAGRYRRRQMRRVRGPWLRYERWHSRELLTLSTLSLSDKSLNLFKKFVEIP